MRIQELPTWELLQRELTWVSNMDAFKSIAFFHHILLSKNALGKEGAL